jgi:hypothetical protein
MMTENFEQPQKATTESDTANMSEVAVTQVVAAAAIEVSEAAIEVAKRKTKVLVVDDELAGLKFFHLPDEIKTLLGDLTSPEVSEIWEYASKICGFKLLDEEPPPVIRKFLNSDELVSDIFFNEEFKNNVGEPLKTSLSHFYGHAAKIDALRSCIDQAFPDSEFDLTFVAARPSSPAELLQYDLLILDLVLPSSASAVDEIVYYLSALGKDAFPQPLPCIIVMSSSPELIEHQIQFSTRSNISAAGLLILAKSQLEKADFGAAGLDLIYRQLDRQRDVAQKMRAFMLAWTDALEAAKENAAKAMWNLDAAAMQEIHLVAHNDNDPYDEYLNALISREYLWHVESASSVVNAISELDSCFRQQFKQPESSPAAIGQRFIAPFVQPKHGRDLISHFTWTGMPLPKALFEIERATALAQFSTMVPFGAVLAPDDLQAGTECLVHITQQCDLNQQRTGQSVQFALAKAKLVKDSVISNYSPDDLVAKGLPVKDEIYDFVLIKGSQIALPRKSFTRLARLKKLRVVGRLRHDIAMHFLLATASHMTRWASQKIGHTATINVTLYLFGANIEGGHKIFNDDATGEALVVQLIKTPSNQLYFRDNTSIKIALWVAQTLSGYDGSNLSTEIICNKLSVGVKNNECLSKYLHLKHAEILPQNVADQVRPDRAPQGKVILLCVETPVA